MTTHHITQPNPCVEAACIACGAWDPDDPENTCPAWAELNASTRGDA